MTCVDTDFPFPENTDFNAELRGANWLNTDAFPQATFTSTAITVTGEETADITGDLTILGLTLARIIWRLAHPAPVLPDGMSRFEEFAASATHIGFYALLILVPLSGWAMASVSPTGVPTFFLLLESLPFAHMPLLGGEAGLAERHSAEIFLKGVHENLSLAMSLLAALHIAAALKHQFIAKDNLIARMVLSARTLPQSSARAGIGLMAALATLAFLGGGIAWGVAQKTMARFLVQLCLRRQFPVVGSSIMSNPPSASPSPLPATL